MFDRRRFLKVSAGGAWLAANGLKAGSATAGEASGPQALPAGALEASELATLPGKVALIKKSFRPPNFETPVHYFQQLFTPNEAFFVRYHLAAIPPVEVATWKLSIDGESIEKSVAFSYEELRRDFEQVEIAAVCMCSGNRRGFSQPHVPGVQWGHGAMGNARWKGVRLRDLLNKAGLKKDAMEIVLDGADAGVLNRTPDFVKSLPVWKAMDENTLVALEMNGEKLPHWNGFPARIVVPGWTATYWIKHLTSIAAQAQSFKGFWMNPAYRIPKGKFAMVDRFVSQETETNTPITEMLVNSLITSPAGGRRHMLGETVQLSGVAWDGGYGIASVEVSEDGGLSWRSSQLGTDLGAAAASDRTIGLADVVAPVHAVACGTPSAQGACGQPDGRHADPGLDLQPGWLSQ